LRKLDKPQSRRTLSRTRSQHRARAELASQVLLLHLLVRPFVLFVCYHYLQPARLAPACSRRQQLMSLTWFNSTDQPTPPQLSSGGMLACLSEVALSTLAHNLGLNFLMIRWLVPAPTLSGTNQLRFPRVPLRAVRSTCLSSAVLGLQARSPASLRPPEPRPSITSSASSI
jgi:hypothetical protein